MAIRTGNDCGLGVPQFTSVETTPQIAPGTVVPGFDDVTGRQNEYIYLLSPAAVAVNDELTYDTAYLGTKVAAGSGQVTAINVSGAGQYAFFRLKRRGVIA